MKENGQEKITGFLRRQTAIMLGVIAANVILLIGVMWYSTMRERALIGSLYRENTVASEIVVDKLFGLELSSANIDAAKEAVVKAGYTENGLKYLYSISGSRAAAAVIVFFICAVLAVVIINHNRIHESLIIKEFYMIKNENIKLKESVEKEKKYNEKNKKEVHDFIENIAHQVKTPLAALTLRLDMMKEGCTNSKMEELVENCLYHTFRINTFVARLLNISRFEAGKVIMACDEIPISSIIKESIDGSGVPKEKIVMKYSGEDTNMDVDEGWLVEALVNLIANCGEYVKDIEDGKIFVDVKKENNDCVIKISDNGHGIEPEKIQGIFNRFETGRSADGFHVGIGLNLSRLIILAHHGSIEAGNSKEYGGAEFKIVLPMFRLKKRK